MVESWHAAEESKKKENKKEERYTLNTIQKLTEFMMQILLSK